MLARLVWQPPALPAAQRAALGRLGMGTLDKVILRFPKRVWPKGADWVERTGNAAVVRKVMRDLRAHTGWKLPGPSAVKIQRWRAYPWTRGSYSIRPPGATMADHNILGQSPGGSRILIGGEATDPAYPSTVHGALRSGAREAARIINGT